MDESDKVEADKDTDPDRQKLHLPTHSGVQKNPFPQWIVQFRAIGTFIADVILEQELVCMERRGSMKTSMAQGNHVNNGAFEYYSRLRRVKEHVDEYYSEEISLEKAAQIAATEKTYFSTFFHQKVGITFTDWLRRLRVAKAIEILKTRNQSICDIAFEVGFGDLRSFERAFKRYTNLTAREFKKSILPERRNLEP